MAEKMPALHRDLAQVARKARLTSAVDDVDKIIAQILEAREKIASEQNPHAASLTLTRLQNPIKEGFEAINNDLKAVSKTQKEFGKALDRSFPVTPLPTDHDAMDGYPELINRAIAMHFLREGNFDVASVFMEEAREMADARSTGDLKGTRVNNDREVDPADLDDDSDENDVHADADADRMTTPNEHNAVASISNFTQEESRHLQEKFQSMYSILQQIKVCNLEPAIHWAHVNSEALEERGSNLEFELSKLQFVWLAKTRSDDPNASSVAGAGMAAASSDFGSAFQYAREHFERFSERHLHEIQRLAAALVFACNTENSPYASVLETAAIFDEVAGTFTREFCSLLGLSAESPLYVAATAGIVALPRLIKFIGATRSKRTEWTTANELAFETPLPASMIYHSIFVCPVSKEQTTESNPPMRLPCGHVLANDSLQHLAKGPRFKCPYCPLEGLLKDARQIIL